jgi:hypothetical protein
LIAVLAVRLGIAPSVLWMEEPRDLVTVVAVLLEES